MNVFHKVTLAALKKNKVRTTATIVGIILSAAMICAVTTSVASLRNFLIEYTIYNDGDWYGSIPSAKEAVLEDLTSSEEVEQLTYAKQLGYAIAEGCANPDKPYLYILGTSDNFDDMMPIHLTGGRYPTSEHEILLPDHLLDNGGVSHKLGDTLTLELGERLLNGNILNQHNPYINDENEGVETIEVRETRVYTVVGFYERPGFESYSAPGYTAITMDSGDEGGIYDLYFKTAEASEFYDYFYALMERHGATEGEINPNLLMYSGVSEFPEFQVVLYGIAAIVIGLILFGAISLIYNAFSISVSERTKQFGLLSSVGATKKQIRKMVFVEAFVISGIGIPLGVLAGIGGIGVTLHFVGDMFVSMGIPKAVPLRLCVTWQSVLAAILIALGTVFVSAWIPSRRATRVTAIDAIRQSKDIQIKNKNVKTSKLTYRLFGLPGVIASKHYKRNRKKYRTTVVSLFMSIVLFISSSSLVYYISEIVEFSYGTLGYDIIYYGDPLREDQDADKLLTEMKQAESVTDGTYYHRYMYRTIVDREMFTNNYIEDYVDGFHEPEMEAENKAYLFVTVLFVEDEEYRRILADNGLDAATYMDPDEPLAIAFDQYHTVSYKSERYVSGNMLNVKEATVYYEKEKTFEGYYLSEIFDDENGNEMCRFESEIDGNDTFVLPYDETYELAEMKFGTVITNAPYFVEGGNDLTLLYPDMATEKVMFDFADNLSTQFVFKSDDHTASFNALENVLSANGMTKNGLYDYAAIIEDNRNFITIINVFAYGFIILISLIAATNVFHTISTSISLRRREFAMLKSVGMTTKGLNKMMNFECLLYGTRALLYGLPTSCLITCVIYRIVAKGAEVGFRLPWTAIGIAILSVFLVVFATMVYSMRKIKKENPIDALKNETL